MKYIKILLFGILTGVFGFFAGIMVWAVLRVMKLGISCLWESIPASLGMTDPTLGYMMIVCLTGGLIIGLWQRSHGILPDSLETVMKIQKERGSYTQYGLGTLAISALLPLIFGGCIGPEAGLTGFIVSLCCLVGENVKYRGHNVAALSEAGIAATLGAIFNAPLFGIVNNLEPDSRDEMFKERLVSKRTRILIYIMGVLGAFGAMELMTTLFGGGSGLPRFARDHSFGIDEWKWFIPLLGAGIVLGFIHLLLNMGTSFIGKKLEKYRVISCLIAGAFLAVSAYLVPFVLFSGEKEMDILMEEWEAYKPAMLILIGLVKIIMVNLCINLGWRGGSIFPIIFASTAMGYGLAGLMGIEGIYGVAVICSSTYGVISGKPLTVIAILLLCFPPVHIVPIAIAALISGKIPLPESLRE